MRNHSIAFQATLTLVSLALLLSSALASAALQSSGPLDAKAIDDYVQSWMELYDVPGVALGIVQDNQVAYLKGYGIVRPFGEPVTPQTPGAIGSIGKTFTALAILQLANKGKLSPGDPLVKHLPEFRTADPPSVYEKISINQLINHRSGLTRQDGVNELLYLPDTGIEDVLAWLATISIKEDRGDTSYSNLNYILLGAVIEKITGMKTEDYIRQNILVPLEMNNSFYTSQDSARRTAMQGHRQIFGFPVPVNERPSPVQHPAGTDFYSSAEDMTRYIQTYFNAGRYGDLVIAVPLQAGTSRLTNGWLDQYWQWYSGSPGSGTRPGHEGGTSTYNAALLLDPAQKTGVILLSNTRLVGGAEEARYATAMTIAIGVLDIINGRTPQPVDASAFNTYYNKLIVMIAVPFLLALWELVSSLAIWPRSFHSGGKTTRLIFYLLLGFDLLMGLALLIGVPLVNGVSWQAAFHARVGEIITILIIALMLLGAVAAKAVILIRSIRSQIR